MKKNEGSLDMALRIIAGIIFLALAFFGLVGSWGYIVGAVVIVLGLGYCPLYQILGINTCKKK